MSRNRTRDPQLIHSDFLRGEMDAVTAADVLRRQTETDVFRGRHRVSVISGSWATGEAQRQLLTALVDLGLAIDDTEIGDLAEDSAFGATPTFAALTNAGTTATVANSVGNDTDGMIELTPGGTGIAAGVVVRLTFAVERPNTNYSVLLHPANPDAAALAVPQVRAASKTVAKWDLTRETTALVTGTTYQWYYHVRDYGY